MEETRQDVALPPVLIPLFKGVVYRDEDPQLWQSLLRVQPRVQDYVQLLGLDLLLHEGEGYAYLRQAPDGDDKPELPRLVPRRQLGYRVSLLLALLRKKLAEHDVSGADPRLVLLREQMVDLVRLFVADSTDEVRLVNRIETDINRVVKMGFVRRLRGEEERFEVRRILAAFVDAQWLSELEEHLRAYREHGMDGSGSDGRKEDD